MVSKASHKSNNISGSDDTISMGIVHSKPYNSYVGRNLSPKAYFQSNVGFRESEREGLIGI